MPNLLYTFLLYPKCNYFICTWRVSSSSQHRKYRKRKYVCLHAWLLLSFSPLPQLNPMQVLALSFVNAIIFHTPDKPRNIDGQTISIECLRITGLCNKCRPRCEKSAPGRAWLLPCLAKQHIKLNSVAVLLQFYKRYLFISKITCPRQ